MTHHILPRLKTNNNVQAINQPGTWAVRTRDLLDKLSKGLKVDKVETEINSIPDMWARPMLFEMALFDREHVLHERILGEWRGLLAMIALKEVAKLNRLTVRQVKVPIPPPLPEGEQETEAQERDFMRTLSKLVPGTSLSTDTTWRTLYVFLFNEQPIGMTSPTTLVATAADYLNRISSQEVGWYNGTHLKDPVGILSPRQKQIVSGWIGKLKTSINSHRGIRMDRWNLVSGLLNDFIIELGAGSCSLNQTGFGIGGQEAGIFKYLDKPADGNLQDASHVRVIPSQGRTPAKPLLVFDRGIAEQWDMAPQDVTVQGGQTLASTRVDVASAEVWKAPDFFTNTLFVVFQESAFPGTIGVGSQSLTLPGGTTIVTPILPLAAKLIAYLTADDLAQRVRWEQAPEGLKIHLFLKLSGPEPNNSAGRTIELTKLYRREEIQTLENVPILEVWPNFKSTSWKAYYTCYSADDIGNTFTVKPYSIGNTIGSETSLKGRRVRRYWRTEEYPEAMICSAPVPNTQTNQIETRDAGLLLLNQPETIQSRQRAYKIGVDFGAANTMVCGRVGDDTFALKFADRKVSVTASGTRAQAELYNLFLPPTESPLPILSFFQNFDNQSGKQLQPFLNGHIYLLAGAGSFDQNQPGLAVDLKWSFDARDRSMVKAFLGQLCLQTCAELAYEGAISVSWAFSYPTAFSAEQIEGFPEIWNQVTTDCVALTGLSRGGLNAKQTESVAAGLYFMKRLQAATGPGTISIDIGGSTSDISVWKGNHHVWQSSVLLAGRNIFSNYLWHNPDFLSVFSVDLSQSSGPRGESEAAKKFYYAWTDALLAYNSDSIFAELPVHAGSVEVKALRQHLALGIGGLLYYIGSLLRYLQQTSVFPKNVPNIYVGGNGSRIFRWLDIDGEERLNGFYKTLFSRGAGGTGKEPFRIVLSHEPKMETAYGLVQDQELHVGNFENKVVAGECFLAEGSSTKPSGDLSEGGRDRWWKCEWDAILTPEDFTKKLAPANHLERLSDFIAAFNDFANSKGLIAPIEMTAEEAEEVRNRLGQSLSKYHDTKATTKILVEPIFIIALRHWLEIRLGG